MDAVYCRLLPLGVDGTGGVWQIGDGSRRGQAGGVIGEEAEFLI